MHISNDEFLRCIFGKQFTRAHVTAFQDDPGDVANSGKDRARCWGGTHFINAKFPDQSNQYFTISLFHKDPDDPKPRRRGRLFEATYVIVLDDVQEKLPLDRVQLLPTPTYKLLTSAASEQWGYVLDTPCADRAAVENLLDGLVKQGLSPEGKDPGMTGVTRYVRLPEGHNTKESRLIFGKPFKCQILDWRPHVKVSMAALAAPFGIDLYRDRGGMTGGVGADVDHPIFEMGDLLTINHAKGNGVFDIVCPWVDDHTGAINNGTAVFTNGDLTLGFKCHHGTCQHRTARHLIDWCESMQPGFRGILQAWKVKKEFEKVMAAPMLPPPPPSEESLAPPPPPSIWDMIIRLREMRYDDPQRPTLAGTLIKLSIEADAIQRIEIHKELRDVMGWDKKELAAVVKEAHQAMIKKPTPGDVSFLGEYVYVGYLKKFYHTKKQQMIDLDGLDQMHRNQMSNIKQVALDGTIPIVDLIDFRPGMPQIFKKNDIEYLNTWRENRLRTGVKGDIQVWKNHFSVLGWSAYLDHVLDWMAYTVQHPDVKVNHMIVLGGPEGVGKDFILEPLRWVMAEYSRVTECEEILAGYTDFLVRTKHLHINEADPINSYEAKRLHTKLKPFAVGMPDTIPMKQRYCPTFCVQNVVNCTLATNTRNFISSGVTHRYLFLWTNLKMHTQNGTVKPEWQKYWTQAWAWLLHRGGREAVAYELQHRDVSEFNPHMRAPMTPWLSDLIQESRDELEVVIEALRHKREGCFARDVVSCGDVVETLRRAQLFHNIDLRSLKHSRVDQIMEGLDHCIRRDVRGQRLYIVANHHNVTQYTDDTIMDYCQTGQTMPNFEGKKSGFLVIPGGLS